MTIFNKLMDITIIAIFTGTAVYLTDSSVLQYLYALLGLLTAVSIGAAKNYK